MQWSDYQIICTRTSSDKIWSSLPKNMLRNIALHHLANVDSHHVYITNLLFTDIKYTSNTQYSHYLPSWFYFFFFKAETKICILFYFLSVYTRDKFLLFLNLFPQEDFILETEIICQWLTEEDLQSTTGASSSDFLFLVCKN